MTWNAANGATAKCGRAAEKDILIFRLHSPCADLVAVGRKRKSRSVLEDISVIKSKSIFDVDRGFAFDAPLAVFRHGKTIFERFGQPLVHAGEKFLLRLDSHRFIIPNEKTPGGIDAEKGQGLETLCAQLWRKNTVV